MGEVPMSKNKSFKTVFATIIVMLVVLASFSYVVLRYLAPVYQLNQNKIFYYAIRLFPLLIGILLITIASILLSHGEDKEDEEDRLPPNSYDKALFDEPCDDPENSKKQEVPNTSEKEEVPFVSVFEEETAKQENSYTAQDSTNEALISAINALADKIDSFSASAVYIPKEEPKEEIEETKSETPSQEEISEDKNDSTTEPEQNIETTSKDESGSAVFKEYEGNPAKVRVHAEYDNAVEYGYNLTLALVDGPIGQVALSIGDNGTCIDLDNKTLVIIPFEDEIEVRDTLDKLELKYEIKTLQDKMSFEDFVENLF